MKLLNYPHIIQTEIFLNLPLYDVVNISLCSNNFKKHLKRSLIRQLEKFWLIQYSCYGKSSVGIQTDASKLKWFHFNIQPISEVEMVCVFKRYNLFGRKFWCCLPTSYKPLTIIADDDQSVIQFVHFHLYSFFGPEKSYIVYSDTYAPYIPLLPNISSSRLCLSYRENILEQFLELSPNHHTLSIHFGIGYEYSEIVGRIPNLAFISYGIDMEFLFPNFQGSKLYVETSYLHEPSAVEFLRKWKSGEGYQQVESVQILNMNNTGKSLVVDHVRLLEQVDVKKLDDSKEPPKFYYWRRSHNHWWKSDQFTSEFYIVRDTDGVVASLSVTRDAFNFGVWKMTETEFLERMRNGTLEIQPPKKWHTIYKPI